jgi:hypothetical protein
MNPYCSIQCRKDIIVIKTSRYQNDNLAVMAFMESGEPYAHVSVNVAPLESNEFVLHHDLNRDKKFLDALINTGFVEYTDNFISYGFVEDQPILKLTMPECL